MNALLKFVAKQLFGQKGMIANNKAVNFEAAKLAEKLSEFGIDPSSIKTEKQLEGIINQIKAFEKKALKDSIEVISQDDPRFKGIMSKMMGSNVIKRDFGKPFKEEVKKAKSDEEILSNIKKSNERSLQNLRMQMMDDKVANDMFQGGPTSRDPKTDADMLAEFIAEDAGKIYDELPTKEKTKFYDRAYKAILRYKRKDPEDMADGGRIGLKDGMDRRTFMKILGGLATLPILGRYFKGAEKAAPVVEKVAETATQAPTYFFDLVTKIKTFGKKSKVGPSDRIDEYSYTGKNGDQYTLTEDIATGDAQITKDKMGIGSSGDKTFDVIEDRTVMEYKSPKKDIDVETQRTIDEAAEYDEYKVEFDQDGTEAGADAIDEMIQKEIIEESKKAAPPIKKASGGLAYMLGE
jgi:hypothetical protein